MREMWVVNRGTDCVTSVGFLDANSYLEKKVESQDFEIILLK